MNDNQDPIEETPIMVLFFGLQHGKLLGVDIHSHPVTVLKQ